MSYINLLFRLYFSQNIKITTISSLKKKRTFENSESWLLIFIKVALTLSLVYTANF